MLHYCLLILLIKIIQQSLKLRYIELTREFLSKENRQFIQDVFRIEVAYLYKSSKLNAIAFERKHKSLHILEENVVVEVIKVLNLISINSHMYFIEDFVQKASIVVTSLARFKKIETLVI